MPFKIDVHNGGAVPCRGGEIIPSREIFRSLIVAIYAVFKPISGIQIRRTRQLSSLLMRLWRIVAVPIWTGILFASMQPVLPRCGIISRKAGEIDAWED
jgi:hypothetical protein